MTGWDLLIVIGAVAIGVALEEWDKWREVRRNARGFKR